MLGMGDDHDAAPLRMNEDMVGAPHTFQDPTGLFQLADKVGAPHSVYYTHHKAPVKSVIRLPSGLGRYPITCIVSQVAASAGFSTPSISTLTS